MLKDPAVSEVISKYMVFVLRIGMTWQCREVLTEASLIVKKNPRQQWTPYLDAYGNNITVLRTYMVLKPKVQKKYIKKSAPVIGHSKSVNTNCN